MHPHQRCSFESPRYDGWRIGWVPVLTPPLPLRAAVVVAGRVGDQVRDLRSAATAASRVEAEAGY
jgi:hypothetical protein